MRRATSFPHIKSSPINCARITLVVPNMGVESGAQKGCYVFYWISTLAFLDLLRRGTTGYLLINPLVAIFFVRTLGGVHCAVTDWLVLFELVTAPQPRIVSRAITMMIFLLPRRPTRLRRMSLSYAPVENKKKHQRQGTCYGKIAKEVCYRRDSVTIAIRADRRGGSSPARVTFGKILQKRYEGYE